MNTSNNLQQFIPELIVTEDSLGKIIPNNGGISMEHMHPQEIPISENTRSEHQSSCGSNGMNSKQEHLNELIALEMRNLSDRAEYNNAQIQLLQTENQKLCEEIEQLKSQQQRHELIISRLFQFFFGNTTNDSKFGAKRKRKFSNTVGTLPFLENGSSNSGTSGNNNQNNTSRHDLQSTSMETQSVSPTGVIIEELLEDSPKNPPEPTTDVKSLLRTNQTSNLPRFANASNTIVPYKAGHVVTKPKSNAKAQLTKPSTVVGNNTTSSGFIKVMINKGGKMQPHLVRVMQSRNQQSAVNSKTATTQHQPIAVTVNSNSAPHLQSGQNYTTSTNVVGRGIGMKVASTDANFSNGSGFSNNAELATTAIENVMEGSVNELVCPEFEHSNIENQFGMGSENPPDNLNVDLPTPSFLGLNEMDEQTLFNPNTPIPPQLLEMNNIGKDEVTFPMRPSIHVNSTQHNPVNEIHSNIQQNQESLDNLRHMLSSSSSNDKVPSPAFPDYLFDVDKSLGDQMDATGKFPDLFSFSPGEAPIFDTFVQMDHPVTNERPDSNDPVPVDKL